MNLKQYIQDNPEKTLTDAHNETELIESLISIPRMRLFLSEADLFLLFYDIAQGKLDTVDAEGNDIIHPAKVYCKLVTSTLDGTSTDDNDFNFIQSTDTGKAVIKMTEAMRDIALPNYSENIQLLLDMCIAKCNDLIYPFAGVTQEDWDKAQLEINPTTEQVSYTDGLDYILNKYRNSVSVEVTITESLPYVDTITFTCESGDTETINDEIVTNYSLNDKQRALIKVPANFTGSLDTTINLSGLKTKVKAFGTSKFNRVFAAKIYNSVG